MCFLESKGVEKKVPCFLFFGGGMSEYIYIYNLIIIIIYAIFIYVYKQCIYIHVTLYTCIYVYTYFHVYTQTCTYIIYITFAHSFSMVHLVSNFLHDSSKAFRHGTVRTTEICGTCVWQSWNTWRANDGYQMRCQVRLGYGTRDGLGLTPRVNDKRCVLTSTWSSTVTQSPNGPNDLYFVRSSPQNKGFYQTKIKGHLGSRQEWFMYITVGFTESV